MIKATKIQFAHTQKGFGTTNCPDSTSIAILNKQSITGIFWSDFLVREFFDDCLLSHLTGRRIE